MPEAKIEPYCPKIQHWLAKTNAVDFQYVHILYRYVIETLVLLITIRVLPKLNRVVFHFLSTDEDVERTRPGLTWAPKHLFPLNPGPLIPRERALTLTDGGRFVLLRNVIKKESYRNNQTYLAGIV